MSYTYVTFGALVTALLERLQDQYATYLTSAGAGFVTPAEATAYLQEALQTLNAQASLWNADYVLPFTAATPWQSLAVLPASPRVRTVTDTDILTAMEYALLEPPTGWTWTGTSQFTLADLSQALIARRDELLQASGANVVRLTGIGSPTAGVTTVLPDTALQLRRVRWVPATGLGYSPYALAREDAGTRDAYGPPVLTDTGEPESWLVTANAPLEFDVSTVPPVPGLWDLLLLEAGPAPAPPAATVLGLPNDWCWVAKWGALADCLSNSPERVDALRAKYCAARYAKGMRAMAELPWLLNVSVGAVATDSPSVQEADAYAQDWEEQWPAGDPQVVVGGMDLVALAPFVTAGTVTANLTVVGNAPIDPTQSVQLARDGVDAVLAYAQHLAMFKCGGQEFAATLPLLQQFEDYCAAC